MVDLVNLGIGNAGVYALLGYLVVFVGLVMLMVVIMVMGRLMAKKAEEPKAEPAAPAAADVEKKTAPGTAGELKLYDTDPKAAAMCMAIVADKLGKPLNELRFISIKEVKE